MSKLFWIFLVCPPIKTVKKFAEFGKGSKMEKWTKEVGRGRWRRKSRNVKKVREEQFPRVAENRKKEERQKRKDHQRAKKNNGWRENFSWGWNKVKHLPSIGIHSYSKEGFRVGTVSMGENIPYDTMGLGKMFDVREGLRKRDGKCTEWVGVGKIMKGN